MHEAGRARDRGVVEAPTRSPRAKMQALPEIPAARIKTTIEEKAGCRRKPRSASRRSFKSPPFLYCLFTT